jgi:hypothetical protein
MFEINPGDLIEVLFDSRDAVTITGPQVPRSFKVSKNAYRAGFYLILDSFVGFLDEHTLEEWPLFLVICGHTGREVMISCPVSKIQIVQRYEDR